MSFFEELKRRKVFRVAATYAVVAWILMQIGEVTFPALNIPEWVMSTLVVVLLAGFPIAVIFAWIFDKTPQGYIKTDAPDTENIGGMNIKVDDRPFYLQKRNIFLALGVIGGILIGTYSGDTFKESIDDKSIAVLPFDNFSKNEDDEYFTDGITEDITMNLAKIKDLTVISRTSVMGYKNTTKKMKEIADELGVKYILEGSVRKLGSRVRIVGQLIDAKSDKHVWSDSYDRDMNDLFKIQADVSKEIANAMQAELSDKTIEQIESIPTENMEAYELYKKARTYHYRSFRETDFNLAVDYYREAIKLESSFALAYAGLSEVHGFIIWMGYDISEERQRMVKSNLNKAKELEPQNPEVQLANAIHLYRQRNYFPAMDQYREIRELQPSNSEIWERIAFIQYRVDQFEESLNNLLEAYKVNPKSPRLVVQVGLGYQLMFDYDNAIKYYDIAIDLAPDISASAYNYKSQAILLRDGNYDLSSKVLDQGILRTSDKNAIWAKTKNLTFRGEYKEALENIAKNKSDFGSFLFNASVIPKELPMAICYNGLGEKAKAENFFSIARKKMEQQVQLSPDDYRTHAGLGIVYSHIGLKKEAIREAKTALAILPPSKDSFFGVYQVLALAYVHMTLGDNNGALDQLETVLNKFGGITVKEIENFPEWKQLRKHPRFIQWKENSQQT